MTLSRRLRVGALAVVTLACLLTASLLGSAMTLQEAIDDPEITVIIESKGVISGDSFRIRIKNNSPDTVTIDIRPGDVLVPRTSGTQRFTITRDTVIVLGPDQEVDLQGLWASCIDPTLPGPPLGATYDTAPNLIEIADALEIDTARLMYEFVEFINANGLQEDETALAGLWAIASGELPRENEEIVGMLFDSGLDPYDLAEPMESFVTPLMLDMPGTYPFESQSFGINTVLDPGLIADIKVLFPIHCQDCVPCNFWALPNGAIGPMFPYCGYSFSGTTFPSVATNLEIKDVCPADGRPELWMSTGQVTVAFPSSVECVEITYCHNASGTFAAYQAGGVLVMAKPFAAQQGVVRTVVLHGGNISFITIVGSEVSISEICVSQ